MTYKDLLELLKVMETNAPKGLEAAKKEDEQ